MRRVHVGSSSNSRYNLESTINTNDVEMIRACGGLLHHLSTTQASDQLMSRGGNSSSDVVLQVTVNRVSQYVLSEYMYVVLSLSLSLSLHTSLKKHTHKTTTGTSTKSACAPWIFLILPYIHHKTEEIARLDFLSSCFSIEPAPQVDVVCFVTG